jgi:DNA-binding winged helix-turn-helix (wHTH) protein
MDAVSFGPFRLYPAQRLLKRREDPVKLGARAFDILLALVERAGEVVAHKELIAEVWPNVIVEEIGLRVHITSLRKALDGEQSSENYITNVKGRGYRGKDALALLSAICDRFTEGIETADLSKAQHLLGDLRSSA